MKHLKYLSFLACLLPQFIYAQNVSDITDLILVTGQSNVRGSQTDYDPTVDGTHPRVFAFTTTRETDAYSTGGTWQLADLHQAWDVDGWHPGNGSLNDSSRTPYNNFAFHFAKTLADSDPDKVVGIVIASAPGEGIQHWDAAGDFAGPKFPDNRFFAEVVETQALAALNAQGVKTSFDAVLWHQGETDWQKEGTSDPDVLSHYLNDSSYDPAQDTTYYPDKLNALINRFRDSNWFAAEKPFICGETKRALVNERLMNLNADGNQWTACVAANDLTTRDATTNHDGTHFDTQGLRNLGQRYGQKYLEMTTSGKPKAGPIKILAVGDSITEGYTPQDNNGNILGTPSYRQEFANLLTNAGCDFEMVGRKTTNYTGNNPQNTYYGNHEGYSGQRANHILNGLNWDYTSNKPTAGSGSWSNPGITQMMLDDDPDVVLLHIGTNDLRGGDTVAGTATEIQQIISTIQSGTNSDTKVFIANVIPHYPNTQWNSNVNQSITDLGNILNNTFNNPNNPVPNVYLADVNSNYLASYMQADMVHPNTDGENHIADAFHSALSTANICSEPSTSDTTAPTTVISVPAAGAAVDGSSTYSGTASDTGGSGFDKVRIAIQRSDGFWFNFTNIGDAFGNISVNGDERGITDNATLSNTTDSFTNWQINVTLPPGNYEIFALAVDNAGNDAYSDSDLPVWPVKNNFSVHTRSPQITGPAPDATLTDSTAHFSWTPNGASPNAWAIYVGANTGGTQYYVGSTGTNTSVTVNGLPTDGSTIYVRLLQLVGGTWSVADDVTYTALNNNTPPEIIVPEPGSALTGSTAEFIWNANGTSPSAWALYVGSSVGGTQYYVGGTGTSTSVTVNGLPTDGSTVYVRLLQLVGGTWSVADDVTYTALNNNTPPEIIVPEPGSALTGSTAEFVWNANGTSPSAWALYVGSSVGGTQYYVGGTGTSTSVTVNGLPTDGSTIYVRLLKLVGGSWSVADDATRTAFDSGEPLNETPVTTDDVLAIVAGEKGLTNVVANDNDDSPLTESVISIVSVPLHGAAEVVNGQIEYQHLGADGIEFPTDSFTYLITDAGGLESNVATVTINIEAQNDAPLTASDSVGIAKGDSVTIVVLGNDSDPNNQDGNSPLRAIDPTTVQIILPDFTDSTQPPLNGTLLVDDINGTVAYTHNNGAATNASFRYTVADLQGARSLPAQVSITIAQPQNLQPTAVDDSITLIQAAAVAIDVAANDADSDGSIDKATVTAALPAPVHGTIAIDPVSGVITYTPDSGLTNETLDEFGYTIDDDEGFSSNIAVVTVTLPAGNPSTLAAIDDSASVAAGSSVDINVLANDVGLLAPATVDTNVLPEAQLGFLSKDDVTGVITYTAHDGTSGTDTFGYTVNDTNGVVSDVAIVTVTVTSGSVDTFAANDDAATVSSGGSVQIEVLANDTGALSAGSVDTNFTPGAEFGYLALDEDTGIITYTAYEGAGGVDTFRYTVNDSNGVASNVATVTVTVTSGASNVLLAVNDTAAVAEGGSVDIGLLANDSGVLDQSTVDTNVAPQALSGSLAYNEMTGVLTYTPYAGVTGTDTFGYTVQDTNGTVSNIATVTVTIGNGSNGALLAVDDTATVIDGGSVELDLVGNDTGSIDPLSIETGSEPQALLGYLSKDDQTGVITYTSYGGTIGTDRFA